MTQITWQCDKCGNDIANGEGWIQVLMSDVMDLEEKVRQWEAEYTPPGTMGVSIQDLGKHPGRVSWRVRHGECDESEGAPYAIGVDEIRSAWDLVEWTAHLMEKTWLNSTNWRSVMEQKRRESTRS